MDWKYNYFKHKNATIDLRAFSLKQGYFCEMNYCKTDVMFHETAGAQWPLPAAEATWLLKWCHLMQFY